MLTEPIILNFNDTENRYCPNVGLFRLLGSTVDVIFNFSSFYSLKERSACCAADVYCRPFKVFDVEDLKLYNCLSPPSKMVNNLIKSRQYSNCPYVIN